MDNMVITIPPRGQKPDDQPLSLPAAAKKQKPLPKIVIDQIVCDETTLLMLPKQVGKEPLDFDIHDLILKSVGAAKPFSFRGNLTNAKPVGEIKTKGNFGPWAIDDPGSTPVSGNYTFTDADLDLSRELREAVVDGKIFGGAGKPGSAGSNGYAGIFAGSGWAAVPLHTEFYATVDGTNGDTYLHPVRATLIHSEITANGSVVRVPEKQGHLITLDVVSPKARLEDLLQLSTKSNQADDERPGEPENKTSFAARQS